MELIRRRLGKLPVSRLFVSARRPSWRPLQHRPWRFNSTFATPIPAPEEAITNAVDSPGIVLRNYQEESIQSVLRYLDQGHNRLGISLATGAGKTVIFTQLISRIPQHHDRGDKSLIIVHRRELVEQAARHCQLAYPDKRVEIEMGNSMASGSADIIIASVRSLASRGRFERFDPRSFKLVLVDEAHHIVARSYREVLKYLGLSEPSQESPVLVGVSATFSRFDGLKLGAAIDHIVYHKDYVDLIDENWLSNAVFTTVQSEANLSKVKKDSFGDFATGSLSEAVNTERSNRITVQAWLANANERKSTLVFCVDVAHAKELTEMFRAHGIDARYITGATSKDLRAKQLDAFKNQEYPVLVNCALFTEGTDIPNIDCVLLARPTRSRNLLIQMIGRGLRLYPGKENCHIIDMVATLETGVISTPTLFGLHPDEVLDKSNVAELKDRESRVENDNGDAEAPTDGPENDTLDGDIKLTFTKYDTIYDLIGDMRFDRHIRSLSSNSWVRVGEDRYHLSDKSGWLTIEKSKDTFDVRHVTMFKTPTDHTQYTRPRLIASATDLDTAVRAADTFASSEFEEHYIASWKGWRRYPATTSQIQVLNKAKVRNEKLGPSDLTRGQAADMITKLKHGGKKRFTASASERQALQKREKKREKDARELEKLKQREDVKVGPVAN
ncbi:hypothetical protein ASPWEDRAFT_23894 [Aspergillus wentii DTO 134E9]|uniref:Helicase ATP-binding domain-containing protein n=1 Tax=Aspergillus wentii DTO 134E9 TaxID=1073089 RepID=A0A1L9S3Z0_ASPWE|nr:uncharacterized protein ASPWEDRAFT_23894 [Aspergillus wentii DTO 134E9]KAI9930169.1 hypothetical protein MW887_011980 [Aspergillus wentii]OJJ41841.1 hypothetical protein ASPWEDRAFT_23894 [Aspergillus wentii DTO 134E9]